MTNTVTNATMKLVTEHGTDSIHSGISVVGLRREVSAEMEVDNCISALGSRKRNTRSLEQLQDIAESLRRKEDLSLDEKTRKMSIIYSRRKRIKHKMRLRDLETQHAALAAENKRVRRENGELEAMIERSLAFAAVSERAKLDAAVRLLERQQLMATLAAPKVLAQPHPVGGQPPAFDMLLAQSFGATSFRSALQEARLRSMLNHPGESDFLFSSLP
jgi:hypothetical protein